MSSKGEDEVESEVSRFALDGIVAEMVIEVEDKDQKVVDDEKSPAKGKTVEEDTDGPHDKGALENEDNHEKDDAKEDEKSVENEDKSEKDYTTEDKSVKDDATEDKLEKDDATEDKLEKDDATEDKLEKNDTTEDRKSDENNDNSEKDGTKKNKKFVENKDNSEREDIEKDNEAAKEDSPLKHNTENDREDSPDKDSLDCTEMEENMEESESSNDASVQPEKARGRGRPRKIQKVIKIEDDNTPKRSRGRPKKVVVIDSGLDSAKKKSVGRPKKTVNIESKSDSDGSGVEDDESKNSQKKAASSIPETSILKRNHETIISKEETNEVPMKKLRSSLNILSKQSRRSVSFSPVITTVDQSKAQNLRNPMVKTPSKITPSKGTPNAKYKAWSYPKNSKLESFIDIRNRIYHAELKNIKCVYRALFNKKPAEGVQGKTLRRELLNFSGFPFTKNSSEYKKHLSHLQKMNDSSLHLVTKVLGLKEKSISSIMEFLLKPSRIIYCQVDPYAASMQPVLQLQRIPWNKEEIECINLSHDENSSNETFSNEDSLVTGKRKRFISTKLRFYESDFDLPASKRKSQETEKSFKASSVKKSAAASKVAAIKARNAKKAILKNAKKQTVIKNEKKKVKVVPKKKEKKNYFSDTKMKIVKKPFSSDIEARRKALDLAIQIQETVDNSDLEEGFELDTADESVPEEDELIQEDELNETHLKIKQEVFSGEDSEEKEKSLKSHGEESKAEENSSSEVTLSAEEDLNEETLEGTQKKRPHKPPVIPLKSFPKIKENILNASVGELQRFHLALFGAPDKVSNIRGNCLSFGGFPFYEGSKDWKQKEFVLSLLSQTTIKEYLDILDIKCTREKKQGQLVKKFMKFLVAPIGRSPDANNANMDEDGDIGVVSVDELVPDLDHIVLPPRPPLKSSRKSFVEDKKPKKSKKNTENKPPKMRKVLMDEAQVRRLEADLAREQRIMEREKKLHEEHIKSLKLPSYSKGKLPEVKKGETSENQTDAELLSALMETVYQRRELKKAGAKVSIPNKGGHTRLGELSNVKFLVVTANYSDLDVLHHLIYMTEANKGRVRKNILDFAGFNFTEDSPAYEDRMNFLTSLGYDISKRIAFLLGLCPYKTLIAQQDLNELIMYFLMSPCQSKQVPIRHMPNTFFSNEMPPELSALVAKHSGSGDLTITPVKESKTPVLGKGKNTLQITISPKSTPSVSKDTIAPRAKKSFSKSSFISPRMKGLVPSISTKPFRAAANLVKLGTPETPIPAAVARQALESQSLLNSTTKELIIQQQTPDGTQKTFKLVKLPLDHPLNKTLKVPATQPAASPTSNIPGSQSVTINPPVIGAPGLPPGLIVFKNNPTSPNLSAVMQTVPLAIGQSTTAPPLVVPKPPLTLPKLDGSSPVVFSTLPVEKEKDSANGKDESVPVECNDSSDEEEQLCPLEDSSPPTDEEIYSTIQDIIHECSSLEDITLKNVFRKVAAKYPNFDLTSQHFFMKECVKKIIIGT